MQLPQSAQQLLAANQQQLENGANVPAIATQCFMLSNMFDPTTYAFVANTREC